MDGQIDTAKNIFLSLQESLGNLIPSILGAVVILIGGWIIALILSSIIGRCGSMLSDKLGASPNLKQYLSKGVFWIVLLFAVFAALSKLNLPSSVNDTLAQGMSFLPKLFKAAVLGLGGWLLATLVRLGASKALAATSLDDKLSAESGTSGLSGNIGDLLYWLIFLLFLPLVLGALELDSLLVPVQAMIQKMLSILPNIIGAGVIGMVGWMLSKILRSITTSALSAAGADSWGQKIGLQEGTSVSGFAGLLVSIFVFVPALIAALNALGIDAISRPATAMLEKMMDAIPNLLAAGALLTITYYVGRFVATTLAQVLSGVGMDELPAKLGFADLELDTKPSVLVGKIALFYTMLFATVEASNMLGFEQIRNIVTLFIQFGGQILLGGIILVIGFWLANLVHSTIIKLGGEAQTGAANLARVAIMGLVAAMGLRAMGLADDIVNLAFGLTLGSVAVAIALAFGLGGREAAGKQMEYWLSNLRK